MWNLSGDQKKQLRLLATPPEIRLEQTGDVTWVRGEVDLDTTSLGAAPCISVTPHPWMPSRNQARGLPNPDYWHVQMIACGFGLAISRSTHTKQVTVPVHTSSLLVRNKYVSVTPRTVRSTGFERVVSGLTSSRQAAATASIKSRVDTWHNGTPIFRNPSHRCCH